MALTRFALESVPVTYRQALANLAGDDMLVIKLKDGDMMRNARARVRRAAKAVDRHVLLASWDKQTLCVGLPPPTSLVTVLSSIFPTLTSTLSPVPDCWISRVMAERVDSLFYPQPLRHIARALEAVDRCGELPHLTRRFVLEHPLHRSHRRDYDEQLITCLTEGCALAWADLRQLGPVRFTSQIEGAPDIQADSGLWIEAKSIGPSKEDRQLIESMRANKEPHVGTPQLPGEGLWRKLDYVVRDTQKKLDRQTQRDGVLFLHLTTLDIPSWPLKDEFFALLPAWVERKKLETPNIRIVATYNYDWPTPVIDPFNSEQ